MNPPVKIKIIGSYLSPYVRKVLAVLHLKGIAYEIDPIVAFARYSVDAIRWPRTAAFVERVLKQDCFEKLKPYEDKMLRTPIAKHREALAVLGAPLMSETYGAATPRRGRMRI